MIRYIPQPCDTDPNELESLADFHVSKENERTASILRAYAATLRQQAGRVDEVTDDMVERAWLAYDEAVETCAASDLPAKLRVAMRAALTAALAQNTQGEAVAYRVLSPGGKKWVYKTAPLNVDAFRHAGMQIDPLYLHTERARVPEDDNSAAVAAIQFALAGEEGMAFLRCWNEGNFAACRDEWPEAPAECYVGADPLAAPSQRAKVK